MTPALSRPDGGSEKGVSFRTMANRKASSSPRTKTGIDTPKFANTIVPTSVFELCRYAEISPSGTPTQTAKIIAMMRQLDGRRQALDEELRDGLRVLDRDAEVAAAELLEIADELDRDRLVQPVAMDEVVAEGIGRAFAEDRPAGVARDEPGEREHDEDDPQQDGDGDENPTDDELGH